VWVRNPKVQFVNHLSSNASCNLENCPRGMSVSIYQEVAALQAVVAGLQLSLQQANETTTRRLAELEASASSSGDTAWLLTSTTLVLMMTIPGLAFFYGGLAQQVGVVLPLRQFARGLVFVQALTATLCTAQSNLVLSLPSLLFSSMCLPLTGL